jgi:NADH dehydrogenase FAD-containing subunit
MPRPRPRQRIVIVGAGFAGFHAARHLARLTKHTPGIEVGQTTPRPGD